MRFPICLLGIIVVTACAAPVKLSEGMPNTLVVVNQTGAKEVVYDLRGDWVSEDGAITIKQEGPVVEAFWKEYHGCCSCPVGHKWFRGTIEGSRANGVRQLCLSPRVEFSTMYIEEGGDSLSIGFLNVDRPDILILKRVK